jgi:hypothetical protein
LLIKSDEERYVLGEVIIPWEVDVQGDLFTADAVRRAAHRWLAKGLTRNVDSDHNRIVNGTVIVESFVVRGEDPDGFRPGAWVVGGYVTDDSLWDAVKKGEINGWSFEGHGIMSKATGVVARPIRLEGDTEATELDGAYHTHTINATVGEDGRFDPSQYTGPGPDGHVHSLGRMGGTGTSLGHSHRIVTVD